ncbi:MAG: elongation factor G [Gemmataceae bacterium]
MAAKATTDLSTFRNLGIIAHIDAGKTTTTEHLLYYSGAKHKLGGVDEGTTETDYDPEEQERGITIYSACIPFKWRDCTINLIDTPGHVDFTAEVERSLRVLDGCVVVFDAQKGVEAQSETVWRQANKYNVPRMVFVNKMDVVGANFEKTLDAIRKRLAGRPVPIVIPIGAGSPKDSDHPFAGVIDVIEMKALSFDPDDFGKTVKVEEIPEDLLPVAQTYREQMFDALTENDEKDRLTSAYLEGKPIPAETVRQVIRELTLARHIQPVLAGSGREHIGIQPLLDAVTYYLPSPLDRPPVEGQNPRREDKVERRKPDPKEPFCGLVFKIVADTHGELYYVRIYSGTLKSNSKVLNPGRNAKEVVGKLYHIMADPTDRRELPEAAAGDIVALHGLKESITGDTLCETQHPLLLERISFAQAVVSRSIEPETTADKQKLTDTLNLLKKEDPTFTWTVDKDTGQTLMNGMGMLHLEIKQHRMERDFRLKVRVGKPLVSYRETLKSRARVEGECVKQTGAAGGGLFAKVSAEIEPHRPDPAKNEEPILVVSRVKHDALPEAFVEAALRGLRGALDSGELGYPMMNVKATLLGGEQDEEVSNDVAFEAAGADAVRKAMRDNMVLLEPWMRLQVTAPSDYGGSVIGDINARRGEVVQFEVPPESQDANIVGHVPLANLFDYADKLRSLSQGRGASTMEPLDYRPAPPDVLNRLLHPEDYY